MLTNKELGEILKRLVELLDDYRPDDKMYLEDQPEVDIEIDGACMKAERAITALERGTKYIAVKSNRAYIYDSLEAWAKDMFFINVGDDGVVRAHGHTDTIYYDPAKFTKEQIFTDYCNKHLPSLAKMWSCDVYEARQLD
jgi:hypothetical protein